MTDWGWRIELGNCLDVLAMLPDECVDAVVSDPPYGLGFMGKAWDHSVPGPEYWRAVLRVMKPGAHLVAMGGTRTAHRLACAIEDAGFELRDSIAWIYGSGFPKSLNISKALADERCGCDERSKGSEPVLQHDMRPVRSGDVSAAVSTAREPGQVLQPVMSEQGAPKHRPAETVAANARREQPSVEGGRYLPEAQGELPDLGEVRSLPGGIDDDGAQRRLRHGASTDHCEVGGSTVDANGSGAPRRSQSDEQQPAEPGIVAGQSEPQVSGAWPACGRCGKPRIPSGLGTALKPAYEPIIVARKPLDGTVAANLERHGTGAINVDGCRVGTDKRTYKGSGVSHQRYSDAGAGLRDGRGAEIEFSANGRWPPNLLLAHLPECRRVGTKRVKGAQNTAGPLGGYSGSEGSYERGTGREYGEAETISAYDCADGCPVRAMGEQSGERPGMSGGGSHAPDYPGGMFGGIDAPHLARNDSGDASRFFPQFELGEMDAPFRYVAKASRAEREAGCEDLPAKTAAEATHSKEGQARLDSPRTGAGRTAESVRNHHPTVKPVELMRWLCRLITPPGGLVLDPFCGSGSTGVGATAEGFRFIGIDKDPDYVAIASARITHRVGDVGAMKPPQAPSNHNRAPQLKLF